MKRIVFLFFVSAIFNFSCRKFDESKRDKRLTSFEIIQQSGLGITQNTYAFHYDEQGRVIKVNDQIFHYGANGQIDYSRVERKGQFNGNMEKRIARLSYHWDEQNRLKSIVIDSLYYKSSSIPGSTIVKEAESISKDVLVSSYTYGAGVSLPQKIVYRKLDLTRWSVQLEEEVSHSYQGENMDQGRSFGYLPVTALPNYNETLPSGLTVYSFYQYSSVGNPLYPIYRQMGFNPIDINQVVSKNLQNAFFSTVELGKVDSKMEPDWTKKTNVKITLDAEGRASVMSYALKGDVKEVKNVIFGEVLQNYTYE